MKKSLNAFFRVFMLVIVFIMLFMTGTLGVDTITARDSNDWVLVWNDEFDGKAIDTNKWLFLVRPGTNHEAYETDKPDNAFIQNGNLVIRTIQENYLGRNYTTARLMTYGKFSPTYGRFEARIKIPYGKGLWPGFWLEGADVNSVGWPKCGEIDIMENIGKRPQIAYGTVHGPAEPRGKYVAGYRLESGNLCDDYHIYAVEWDSSGIIWFVDDTKYLTVTKNQLEAANNWVFDKPFFIILNLSVGGDWGGSPDSTTFFPADMLVDYVRVYQKK